MAGSYNWDYLLDWGPQYQPLAHVFHEISALKDEAGQVSGVAAGPVPPIITSRPPRHVHAPAMHARSPLSHEMLGLSSTAMSPSFSPALSPLATRSPSISPLAVSGHPGTVAGVTRGITMVRPDTHYNDPYSDLTEPELRI